MLSDGLRDCEDPECCENKDCQSNQVIINQSNQVISNQSYQAITNQSNQVISNQSNQVQI